MDQLLKELASSSAGGASSTASGGNPFKAFARRAQLVITGLVHISVLLLPRQPEESCGGSGGAAGGKGAGSSKGGAGSAGAGSSRAGGASSSSGGACDPAAELAAAGFPSDGSNYEEWQRVSAGWGLWWGGICMQAQEALDAPTGLQLFVCLCRSCCHGAAVVHGKWMAGVHSAGAWLPRAAAQSVSGLVALDPLPQVQSLLDRTATGGMDWANCCVYSVTEEGGAVVQPEVGCCGCTVTVPACDLKRECVLQVLTVVCWSCPAYRSAHEQFSIDLVIVLCPAKFTVHPCCPARSRRTRSVAPPPITRRK